MIVIIDGWWGSGKSTLRGLLDGHPQLNVCPVQDAILGLSRVKEWRRICQSRDLVALRRALCAQTNYYRVERDARQQLAFNAPAGSEFDPTRFSFDFYQFDKVFIDRVAGLPDWDFDSLTHALYASFFDVWSSHDPRINLAPNRYVSMDDNVRGGVEFLLKNSRAAKYIWVDREPEDVAAVLCKRTSVKGNLATSAWGNVTPRRLCWGGSIARHARRTSKVAKLASEHPDQVCVVSLNDLVDNIEETTATIAAFLGITNDGVLTQFTFASESFRGSDRYTASVNDKAIDVFTGREISRMRRQAYLAKRLPLHPCFWRQSLKDVGGHLIRLL